MKTIGVVGAGVMGSGVAESAAEAGFEVILTDINEAVLSKALDSVRKSARMRKMFQRQTDLDPDRIVSRIATSTEIGSLEACDFLVENVTEDIALKERLYPELDKICRDDVVFAVDTSCVPIGRLAAKTSRPDRVLGIHFMNPVPLKHTVEVIRGDATSDESLKTALDFLAAMGKKGIVVGDAPGFVSNRVLMLTINESIHVVEEGTAKVEQVDAIFKECFGHKMGPLETADLIGLDTIRNSLLVLYQLTDDPRFRPAVLLDEKVAAGDLGRKTGKGFHAYANQTNG